MYYLLKEDVFLINILLILFFKGPYGRTISGIMTQQGPKIYSEMHKEFEITLYHLPVL